MNCTKQWSVLGAVVAVALVATSRARGSFQGQGERGDKKKISLAITKERLEQAPVFKKEVESEVCDPGWLAKVYPFYSVRPYWSPGEPVDR
jgi:hypothetical protein